MNKINAFLIQEERGYHASFKLLKATLCRAGFTIHHLGAKPPKDIPWKWEPQDSKPTLFLGSLLFDKYALSGDEKERWAEYIKEAICRGAGLVTMLDESTVGVLSRLSTKLDAYTEDVKIPVATDTQAYGITFRPLLTETGKGHDATKWLADKELPPFGSLNRSYYRTLARKDATVLMEVPESVDQKPTMIEDLVKHGIAGNYVVGETYPFVVVRNRIAIMAADWSYTGGREFIRWPHASIWLAGLGRWVVGRDMKDMSSPAMSATPVYWFLNYDCQETVPNWQWIKGKLSTPVEAPTAPVKGVVQASLGSRQVTDLPCGDAPVVSEKNGILEAKLCNRIVVRLNKAAMQAGYRLDQPAGNGVVVADDSTESKPAHMLSPWKCAEYVEPPRIEGASLVVTYNLYSDENKQKQTGTLSWTFTPAVKEIEGTKWHCVGEKFALSSDIDVERFISPPHRWRLGGAAEDHWTQRFACYGAKRGFFQTRFDKEGFMFSLCSHLISDLDKGKSVLEVSNELREHFKEKGVTLSDKATVGVELAGSKWLIADADQKYYIRSNDQHQLNVYQETTSEPFYWFHSGQPFQMLTYKGKDEARTLWCYTTTPACVRSEVRRPPTCNYIDIDLQVALGRQSGKIELPIFWYCFVEQGFDHNLWLAAYDYVRQYFLSKFNIERTYPRPTAMLRYNVMYLNDLKNYADTFVPLAKELGFKRIDCGVRYVNDLFFPLHGRIEALRYLCKKAYEAGIEVIFYCGASWHHERDSQLATAKKPEEDYCDDPQLVPGTIEGSSWRIKNDDGENIVWSNPNNQSECHEVDGLKRKVVLLGLDTDWYTVSLNRYDCLKQQTRIDDLKEKPGIAGVWLDSWDIPNHYKFVNYAKSPAVPTVERAMNYIAELQERGYLVLVEGQSPVALDSFWYQTEKYEPMVGNEFCFSGMSPFASNEDGLLTSDLFRLLAYGCAMFQDIRLLSDANNKVTKLAKECNKMMNSIHEKLGMPQRIREMSIAAIDGHSPVVLVQECKEDIEHAPIGTFWECKKGIAIFGLRTAQQLRIDLPSRVQGDFSVEQYDVRLNQGTTKMKLRTDDKRAYLEGRLFSGGVVILKRI